MQSQPMEFLKEASIMHTIDSEHIVRLYGVVLDTNALMLVSLFISNLYNIWDYVNFVWFPWANDRKWSLH